MANHPIFISYSTNQADVAKRVCEFLESHGIPCWMAPRDIGKGDSYPTQIVHAIRNCSVFALMASNSTNQSAHISNEVRIAFDSGKQIIPFVIEEMVFSDEFIYFVGGKQWINAYNDFDEGLDELLNAIKEYLSGRTMQIGTAGTIGSGPSGITARTETAAEAEPADTPVLDKPELIKKLIAHANAYSNNEIKRFADEMQFKRLNDLANSIFSQNTIVKKKNRPVEQQPVLDFLMNELLSSEAEQSESGIIRITGLPGTGKKTLMLLLFWKLLQAFRNGETSFCPFYLALGYFEDARYDENNIAEEIKARMSADLEFYFDYCENNKEVRPLLLIDDVRDYLIGRVEPEKILYELLKDHPVDHRIICVDTGVVKNPDRIKLVIPILPSTKVKLSCQILPLDIHDEEAATEFIAAVLAYTNISAPAEQVYSIISHFGVQSVDMFIIKAIAEELLTSPDEMVSLGSLYHKWALVPFLGAENELRTVASDITDYIFSEDYDMERINFNSPQWLLLHTHALYLSFLLAYHFVQLIDQYGKQQSYDRNLFNVNMTASMELFAGDLIREDQDTQDRLLKIVQDDFSSFTSVQKANAVFWLAKIPRRNISTFTAGIRFLKNIYPECYADARKLDGHSKENYDAQYLFRSICYSLIAFGQPKVLDEYMCLLISNDSSNEINRGALLDFYSNNYSLAANKEYSFDDNLLAGDDAIRALIWKVKSAYQFGLNTFPEIDLLSLCMFLQMRIQSSESQKPENLDAWVRQTLQLIGECKSRPQNTGSGRIDYFFSSIADDFRIYLEDSKGFDISQQMYNTLRNLRNIKRKQWTSHNIEDPESIAEHLYSAWMMAMIFLPNQFNEENYSKQIILDMLLIHDMAESVLGDQVISLNEPTETLDKHNDVMRNLFLKGTYPNIASLSYYYDIWADYYQGTSINARIARDINIIQTVYTYREYSSFCPEKFSEQDKNIWMNNKNDIETDIGYEIYEKLIESNMDFRRVLKICSDKEETDSKKTWEAGKTAAGNVQETGNGTEPETAAEKSEPEWRTIGMNELRSANLTVDDVKQLALNVKDAIIISADGTPNDSWMNLFDELPNAWRILVNQKNVPAGFWFFLALSEEYFLQARSGKLPEDRISIDAVDVIELPGVYHGYLLMDGLLPEYRSAASVRVLYNALAEQLDKYAEEDIFFDEICGIGVSAVGTSLFKRMGFKKLCPYLVTGNVYSCSMKNLAENEFFQGFPQLIIKYAKHFKA